MNEIPLFCRLRVPPKKKRPGNYIDIIGNIGQNWKLREIETSTTNKAAHDFKNHAILYAYCINDALFTYWQKFCNWAFLYSTDHKMCASGFQKGMNKNMPNEFNSSTSVLEMLKETENRMRHSATNTFKFRVCGYWTSKSSISWKHVRQEGGNWSGKNWTHSCVFWMTARHLKVLNIVCSFHASYMAQVIKMSLS